ESIRLNYLIDDESLGYRAQAYELSLANSMQVIKLLCGEKFSPYSAHFMHQRLGDRQSYRDVFNCPVHFDQTWCGFYLPVSTFAIPLASEDHQTWQMANRYLESQQAPDAITITEDVIRLIRT